MFSYKIDDRLRALGRRFKEFRLDRNESQQRFAARLGVSIPTLRKLEKGDPSVAIGTWAQGLWLLDHIEDLDKILMQTSLFAKWESRQRTKKRQRASKRERR